MIIGFTFLGSFLVVITQMISLITEYPKIAQIVIVLITILMMHNVSSLQGKMFFNDLTGNPHSARQSLYHPPFAAINSIPFTYQPGQYESGQPRQQTET